MTQRKRKQSRKHEKDSDKKESRSQSVGRPGKEQVNTHPKTTRILAA